MRTILTGAFLLLWPAFALQAGLKLPTFQESMARSAHFSASFASEDQSWNRIAKSYEAFIQKKTRAAHSIPPYIHFIFVGGSVPDYIDETIETWRKLHPKWTIKVWQDADVATFRMKNKQAFDAAQDPHVRATIWSYEILHRFGGLYVDVDCECLKSFNTLRKKCTFFAGVTHDKIATLSPSLIGSRARHPILKACINSIPQHGAEVLTSAYFAEVNKLSYKPVIFPVSYFSPLPDRFWHPKRALSKVRSKWQKPESYTIYYGPGRRKLMKDEKLETGSNKNKIIRQQRTKK